MEEGEEGEEEEEEGEEEEEEEEEGRRRRGGGGGSHLPVYSEKQRVRGDLTIFSAKRSFLLRKRMMEVSSNHRLLQMESNSLMLSIMRFCGVCVCVCVRTVMI